VRATVKRHVRSGSAELCVEDTATGGPALVCLHAGVTDKRLWAPQLEAFGATHRVVAYDRRGFGETRLPSSREREPFAHVDDLRAVLDALAIDRAVLMGCSQGGRIALDMTLAHPERVRALVLVANAVTGAPENDAPWSPLVQSRIDEYEAAEKRGDQAAVNEIEAQFWLDGPEQPTGRVSGPLRDLFLAMNAIALANGSPGDVIEPSSAWERLEQLRVPTLLIWGSFDFAHLGARLAEVARRIPGAQSVVMDGVAHLPSLERPDEFNRVVQSFLDRLQ